jgi:hypothetical protein
MWIGFTRFLTLQFGGQNTEIAIVSSCYFALLGTSLEVNFRTVTFPLPALGDIGTLLSLSRPHAWYV